MAAVTSRLQTVRVRSAAYALVSSTGAVALESSSTNIRSITPRQVLQAMPAASSSHLSAHPASVAYSGPVQTQISDPSRSGR
jgi:hypothetical protein